MGREESVERGREASSFLSTQYSLKIALGRARRGQHYNILVGSRRRGREMSRRKQKLHSEYKSHYGETD